ncbi:MAG: TonB-dependent receptor [Bacteroidetes bacterium]|nr:MAG: TonB-dependent receptor [Bacteroidota bacterium]
MMKRLLFTLLFIFGLYGYAFAQREVSGRVTDAKGEGIPGASVLIKGTTQGTSTDLDGSFKLKVRSDLDVLVFSGIGLATKETVVGSQSSFNLTLEEDVKILDKEVVVIGYKEIERSRATGQVATVDKKAIENVPIASFEQILQGRAPGLMVSGNTGQPGGSGNTRVRVRGQGSISGNNFPLYIVDGIQIEAGDFGALNPNDFERVDVLKDAPATSIYGSRGANGVIVVTTKRGRVGAPEIRYSQQLGWTTRTTPGFSGMNTAEKIQFERMMANGTPGLYPGVFRGRAGFILQGPGTPQQKEDQIAALAQTDVDWTKYFFRVGTLRTHQLDITGGTEKTKYFISGGYRKEDGILTNSDLERYTLRLNLDQHIIKDLTLGVNFSINHARKNSLPSEGTTQFRSPTIAAWLTNPYNSAYDANGQFIPGQLNAGQGGFTGGTNQVLLLTGNTNFGNQLKFVGNARLNYNVSAVKGLSLTAMVGLDYSNDEAQEYASPNLPTNETASFGNPGNQGSIQTSFSRLGTTTANLLAKYSRTFNQDHEIKGLLGVESVERRGEYFIQESYGLNRQIPYPTPTVNATFIPTIELSQNRNNLISFFADASYSYKGKYNLSVSARTDGSSRFGTNRRFAQFYSVGVSWNLHEENFLENIFKSIKLTTLTLRGSYGGAGNQDLGVIGTAADRFDRGNFRYLALYAGTGGYGTSAGTGPGNLPNPDLSWEQSNTLGIGGDIAFLENRIQLTVDYYQRVTAGLLVDNPVSRTTGFASQTINIGQVRNTGWELSLKADIIKNNHFTWSVNGNITFNDNKVTQLADGQTQIGTGLIVTARDYPLETFNLVRWAGVNPQTGNPQFLDKDGNLVQAYPGAASRTLGASAQVPRFGGFGTDFKYKNLSLSFFFTFTNGNWAYNQVSPYFNAFVIPLLDHGQKNRDLLNMWTAPGQITNTPRAGAPNLTQDLTRYVEDASFIRLRNVQLTYELPKDMLKKVRLKGVRVYAIGQNLLTFTKYTGFDPEVSRADVLNYPAPRVYTIGTDITF